MEMHLTGYDEIETLEKNSIFSFEKSKSMSLFEMKKFIVLKDSLVFIKENQFKWVFPLSTDCTNRILDILQSEQDIFTIKDLLESRPFPEEEEVETFKFTFLNHTIYSNQVFFPDENKTILQWNSQKDVYHANLNTVLTLFFKIVDIVDQSELEIDIKREFDLEREEDGPYFKKYIGQKVRERSQRCWILNLDHPASKDPWHIEYKGSLNFGWKLLAGLNFDSPSMLQESIRHYYGNKLANNANVEALWTVIKSIQTNDTIYLVKDGYVRFKFIVSRPFNEDFNSIGRIDIKKATYFSDVPFNANRIFKTMISSISKDDSIILYFEGEDGKENVDVFTMGQTIFLGPLDSIKEQTRRQQLAYLLPDQIVKLYKDSQNQFYLSKESYKEEFSYYYDFKNMNLEEPMIMEMEEGEPVHIQISDFLTQTELKNCFHHKLLHLTAIVKVVDEKGNTNEVYTPAYYCTNCGRYYVLDECIDRIKKYGSPLCKVVGDSYWTENTESTFRGYSEESMLHLYGYNTAKDQLSDVQRTRILEIMIDEGIVSKEEVLKHLEFLIHSRGKSESMKSAFEKWEKDRKHIQSYLENTRPLTICNTYYLYQSNRLF
ncbi:MAG: hypothetical protein Q4C49_02490 [Bacillota bacterium]|nr:hypothetical protein [Bacillota bacterium]